MDGLLLLALALAAVAIVGALAAAFGVDSSVDARDVTQVLA